MRAPTIAAVLIGLAGSSAMAEEVRATSWFKSPQQVEAIQAWAASKEGVTVTTLRDYSPKGGPHGISGFYTMKEGQSLKEAAEAWQASHMFHMRQLKEQGRDVDENLNVVAIDAKGEKSALQALARDPLVKEVKFEDDGLSEKGNPGASPFTPLKKEQE